MRTKWQEYKTFENWKRKNHSELKDDFDACWYERENSYEPPTFDDYCMGVWQRLD